LLAEWVTDVADDAFVVSSVDAGGAPMATVVPYEDVSKTVAYHMSTGKKIAVASGIIAGSFLLALLIVGLTYDGS